MVTGLEKSVGTTSTWEKCFYAERRNTDLVEPLEKYLGPSDISERYVEAGRTNTHLVGV